MLPRSRYKVITNEVRAIRALREKKGLSVNKAAPLIGTNKSTLTALENGRINLSDTWIEKIIKAYKFPRESFNNILLEKLDSKEDLLKEINELGKSLSYEKLLTIKQILLGFKGGL